MGSENGALRRIRVCGTAAARMISQHWGCPECAGEFGRRSSGGCETCNPPRRPRTLTPEEEL